MFDPVGNFPYFDSPDFLPSNPHFLDFFPDLHLALDKMQMTAPLTVLLAEFFECWLDFEGIYSLCVLVFYKDRRCLMDI